MSRTCSLCPETHDVYTEDTKQYTGNYDNDPHCLVLVGDKRVKGRYNPGRSATPVEHFHCSYKYCGSCDWNLASVSHIIKQRKLD